MEVNITVTYLGHSGFLVKTDEVYLIFDYYIGELPKFPINSTIYVFVSHRHDDHFNPEIFKLTKHNNVTFFLSYDIKLNAYGMRKYGITDEIKKNIFQIRFDEDITINNHILPTRYDNIAGNNYIYPLTSSAKPNEKPDADLVRIRTLKSTDSGVAYLISLHGIHIYHAGDLNWWHWEEEGTCYNNNMAANYKREIKKLATAEKNIDIAFIPLDSRLGNSYYYGLKYFCETINAQIIFPMHFWEDYSCQKRFVGEHGYGERIMFVDYKGQNFKIS